MPLPQFAGCSVLPRSDHGIIILRKTVQNNRHGLSFCDLMPCAAAPTRQETTRTKGLGELMPAQLKETTMDPAKRTMLREVLLADDREGTADSVERMMGSKAEARFAFIFDKAEFASEDLLDVWGRQTFCDGIWVYTGAKYLISRNFLTFTDFPRSPFPSVCASSATAF